MDQEIRIAHVAEPSEWRPAEQLARHAVAVKHVGRGDTGGLPGAEVDNKAGLPMLDRSSDPSGAVAEQ